MDLAQEDSLRLNVMLHQSVHAIRIDESSMTVHALSDRGEAKVKLNPNCRDEQYLKRVRELISSHVLGSPGGYPVYLRRWTRMGQARADSLGRLLLLGEPEAVVAVVHAEGLTDDLARHAWWAMPVAENARRMLARSCVNGSEFGTELARYLLEYLPFETEARDIIESIRLMVQRPTLLSSDERRDLWAKGRTKNTYFVGFLQATPDDLPVDAAPHPRHDELDEALNALALAGNAYARQLARVLAPAGQAFLNSAETVLKKPLNQDVVVALINAIGDYFSVVAPAWANEPSSDAEELVRQAQRYWDAADADEQLLELRSELPDCAPEAAAMLALAGVSEALVLPIFARTDAIGTVMRRKLEPVTGPLLEQFRVLRGSSG
jgi:hypothetical protein